MRKHAPFEHGYPDPMREPRDLEGVGARLAVPATAVEERRDWSATLAKPPTGYHTITPRLIVEDTAAQVAFLKEAFGAGGDHQTERPSEITIGDSRLLISGTDVREPMSAFLYVYVDDVDATYKRALHAGATSLEAPIDLPYGDRRATLTDPFGNIWQIATRQ